MSKPQADIVATRLFRTCEAPNLRACQAIAAPIVGKWQVQYGYNDMMGYWVRFSPFDMEAGAFAILYFSRDALDGILYTSHDHGFTRSDLLGCLLAVDAQAGKKLPK